MISATIQAFFDNDTNTVSIWYPILHHLRAPSSIQCSTTIRPRARSITGDAVIAAVREARGLLILETHVHATTCRRPPYTGADRRQDRHRRHITEVQETFGGV